MSEPITAFMVRNDAHKTLGLRPALGLGVCVTIANRVRVRITIVRSDMRVVCVVVNLARVREGGGL